ncbi:MAG: PEP/pyruvate-binding domain-containing protein [Planctomycetota bacterium]
MPLRFADPHQVDGPFGGKAAGLARLAALGARVPPFFAVEATTTLPSAWTEEDRREFLRRAAGILARGQAAVRSSAVGEDGQAKSFAGLFETVLGVASAEASLAAATRCIASGNGARAVSYAGANGAIPVGLVCQLQVEARSAGVCFTQDPSGKDAAIVIEAVAGLGDRLVSGAAEPERWRVYRTGFGHWEARREGPAAPTLSPVEAIAAAREAADLASRHGRPLDLEWARDGAGTLWWLQARPITAASPPRRIHVDRSCPGTDDGPVTVWANWNIRETMPDPLTPLAWAIWRDVNLRLLVRSVMLLPARSPLFRHLAVLDLVQGRVYWNMNTLLAVPGFGTLTRMALSSIDEQAGRVLGKAFEDGIIRPRALPASRLALFGAMLSAQARGLCVALESLSPRRVARRLESLGEAERARCAIPASSLSDAELIAEIRHLDGRAGEPFVGVMAVMGVAIGIYDWARHAFRHAPEAAGLLVAGLTGNPTTRISIGIDELTEAARPLAARFEGGTAREALARLRSDESGRAWAARLDDFLARFGQRCPKEFDLAAPRWIEDPTMVIDLVRAGLRASPSEGVRARLARLRERRRLAIDSAVASAPWWKRPLLRWLARRVEEHMPLRELPKHHLMWAFFRVRQAVAELGARLARRGVLRAPEEVYFLELSELEAFAGGSPPPADLAGKIAVRRERLAEFEKAPAPDFLRSDGVPIEDDEPPPSDPSVLRGTPVSAGRATGPVRLLRAPDPSLLREGDVLVVGFADPGWTPLFPRARALVMEVGGMMCHAAVVAREMGVPAVFGVRGAMARLSDGEVITVDGDQGTVRRAPDATRAATGREAP